MGRAHLCAISLILIATLFGNHAAAAAGPDPKPPAKDPKIAFELRHGGSDRRSVQIDAQPGDTTTVLEAIAAAGGRVLGAVPGLIEADLPAAAIEKIGARHDVRYVSPLEHLELHSITTEGLPSTATNVWHNEGHRGRGVKIGIVDGTFADYPARQSTGDLPSSLTAMDFCSGGILTPADDGAHGTAVAEIVYDMAPEASLY